MPVAFAHLSSVAVYVTGDFYLNIDIVILAAGQGTRMCSQLPKVLHSIGGKPMVEHVVDCAAQIPESTVHVVVGHGAEAVKEKLQGKCKFVLQSEQLGTGHAVHQALSGLSAGGKTLVLYGDVPLIRFASLQSMLDATNDNALAVLTATLDNPNGYGRIVRDDQQCVRSIVEQKDASVEQLAIQEINTGIMAMPTDRLSEWLPRLNSDNAQNEYYLTDIISMAAADGVAINTPSPSSMFEVQGVNDRCQLAELEREYQFQQVRALMLAGATVADPARVDIRGNAVVGTDVFIDINVVLEGDVVIGDGVSIGAGSVLKNTTIGSGTQIHEHCVLENAEVAIDCQIGPFARFRPGAQLQASAKVGNFVEIKNSVLGVGAKANHLAYIGDSDVGDGSNIGAGTITCNYDGANKYRTVLGERVFVGSNSTLVAPLKIESGAYVGAGSTITKNVDSEKLAIARGKQRNIDGWKKPVKEKK